MSRRASWLTRIALLLVTTLLAGECALQAAARLTRSRDQDASWRPGSTFRILTLGDSHTYGALVPAAGTYPAQLDRLLEERRPGTYSVLNLGVPGMSTTQLRRRLPVYVGRYEPDLVIIWAGVNDHWNYADVDDLQATWLERLDAFAFHSRLYRFVRVNLHDRSLEKAASPQWQGNRAQTESAAPWADDATYTAQQGGVVEHIIHERRDEEISEAEMDARASDNLRGIVRWLRDGGLPVIFIAYPRDEGYYAIANASIRHTATEEAVPLLESGPAIARLKPREEEWLWALHPNGPMYGEVAKDLVELVLAISEP